MGVSHPSGELHSAILLLGPTGSGKTPVGFLLEASGFRGRRCIHFDFGENLRSVAQARERPDFLTESEYGVVRESLQKGTLLENEHFPIARKIFQAFLSAKKAEPNDMVVMNGLPRHLGQARDVDAMVEIRRVINLTCESEVVRQRIQHNSGGDRTGRLDDEAALVERKLELYRERTNPLVEYYQTRGVEIHPVAVRLDTTPQDVLRRIHTEEGA